MAQFKTRARTIDMLGRQQIAGIPTAIHELFKNAHDAYADNVEVDFYRSDRFFVLRDDGVGMTREEFEERWLTLGTESKVGAEQGIKPPPKDPSKEERPIMGEKGIGRLAIAAIGSQVLILTRAKREGKVHDLVAAFIHWGIFECPGINLEEIEIPVVEFSDGTVPGREEVDRLVERVRRNIASIEAKISPDTFSAINRDLNCFVVDPIELDHIHGNPSIKGKESGTHFYLLANESLNSDLDEESDNDTPAKLITSLIGFTNTMTPNHPEPRIKAKFRDRKSEERVTDIIEDNEFFTPIEFQNSDHQIEGLFDEYGQFKGVISIYGSEFKDHIVPWLDSKGKTTECGSFKLSLAYVQGKASQTTLPTSDYARIVKKLNSFGGLYIYKTGIRILPYGNTEYDFLGFEKKRSKKASDAFFSYRRMFGVIEITQEENSSLTEKSGREGFLENKAYRQFRKILMDFFDKIAIDFFREKGTYSDAFQARKAELDKIELAKRKREKLISVKRETLRKGLENFFVSYDSGHPAMSVDKLLGSLESKVKEITALENKEHAAVAFINLESTLRKQLNEIKESLKIVKPRGMGLTKQLRSDWDNYNLEFERLEENLFTPALRTVEEKLAEQAKQIELDISRRMRVEHSINEASEEAGKISRQEARKTKEKLDEINTEIVSLTRESLIEVDRAIRNTLTQVASLDFSVMDDSEIVQHRTTLETQIIDSADKVKSLMEGIRIQLEEITLDNEVGLLEINESREEEILALREQAEADLELTQLGMAIQIINHEFDSNIKSIRSNLRSLKAWAELNSGLKNLYDNIRISFDHLDGYLTLFTPLNRRLYRKPIEITGVDIGHFLEDLFSERLKRHDVKIEMTPTFKRKTIFGYPSTFYPVFVNLIDNAIYWVRETEEPRVIRLDVNGESFLVSDSGRGIPNRDREEIFEFGFTKKPGGRGMGLYISRQVLAREKYSLEVVDSKQLNGATFRIQPISDANEFEE